MITIFMDSPNRTKCFSSLKTNSVDAFYFGFVFTPPRFFFILKSYVPLQRYLLTCQANSAVLGRFTDKLILNTKSKSAIFSKLGVTI